MGGDVTASLVTTDCVVVCVCDDVTVGRCDVTDSVVVCSAGSVVAVIMLSSDVVVKTGDCDVIVVVVVVVVVEGCDVVLGM